jgi:hypothetical protein
MPHCARSTTVGFRLRASPPGMPLGGLGHRISGADTRSGLKTSRDYPRDAVQGRRAIRQYRGALSRSWPLFSAVRESRWYARYRRAQAVRERAVSTQSSRSSFTPRPKPKHRIADSGIDSRLADLVRTGSGRRCPCRCTRRGEASMQRQQQSSPAQGVRMVAIDDNSDQDGY